jgi:hypothetical protein
VPIKGSRGARDLTNAQFPILNSHPEDVRRQAWHQTALGWELGIEN